MVLVDGRHESEFGIVQLRGHENPITSDFVNYFESVPGNVKSFDYGSDIMPKPLSIPFATVNCTSAEAEMRIERFTDLFFDEFGKPKDVKIIFEEEDPQRFYMAKINGRVDKVRVTNRETEFRVDLIAVDPHRYSVVMNDEVTWGNEVITFESTVYTFGHENPESNFTIKTPQSIAVDVIGLSLMPEIKVTGTATNLVITNKGKKISLGTFTSSTWLIDCEHYIGYLNGQEKMVVMDKFVLHKGRNNIQFSGSNLNIEVTIRFRDRWK